MEKTMLRGDKSDAYHKQCNLHFRYGQLSLFLLQVHKDGYET